MPPFPLLLESLRLNEESCERNRLGWRRNIGATEPKQKSTDIYKKWSVSRIIATGIDLPMCEHLQKVPSTRKDEKIVI
jgi:hypothetical protein